MAAGYAHSLVLKTDGTLWGFGYNDYGALGDGTNMDRLIPIRIIPPQ
jgi:alpha-tubulin suppressor-like RCC1 family protein